MKIGTQLREIAKIEQYSQAYIARHTPTQERTISKLFNNRNSNILLLEKIVDTIGYEIVLKKKGCE